MVTVATVTLARVLGVATLEFFLSATTTVAVL
jgi:hypothetical protein